MTEPNKKPSRGGEIVGTLAASAIVGGAIIVPLMGWAGLGWRLFRMAAGW